MDAPERFLCRPLKLTIPGIVQSPGRDFDGLTAHFELALALLALPSTVQRLCIENPNARGKVPVSRLECVKVTVPRPDIDPEQLERFEVGARIVHHEEQRCRAGQGCEEIVESNPELFLWNVLTFAKVVVLSSYGARGGVNLIGKG